MRLPDLILSRRDPRLKSYARGALFFQTTVRVGEALWTTHSCEISPVGSRVPTEGLRMWSAQPRWKQDRALSRGPTRTMILIDSSIEKPPPR